jgi:exopolysaccharide production protein ExoZ
VDLFFVISGFVLWTAAGETPASPGAFLWARVRRVAPLYWIATLAVAALAWRWPAVLPVVHPEPRHVILSLLFLPHWGPGGDPFPLLSAGWTLTYEAFFYVAFAIALCAPKDRRLQVLSCLVGAGSILGFGYHGWYTLLANPLLLEFLAGVGLARRFALALIVGWLSWLSLERPIGSALRRLDRLPLAHRRLGRGLGAAEQEALAAVDADLA